MWNEKENQSGKYCDSKSPPLGNKGITKVARTIGSRTNVQEKTTEVWP
jgi:hypothetical protein